MAIRGDFVAYDGRRHSAPSKARVRAEFLYSSHGAVFSADIDTKHFFHAASPVFSLNIAKRERCAICHGKHR